MSRLTVPPNLIGTPGSDTIQATTTEFNDIGIQVDVDGVIDTRGANDIVSGTASSETSYGINDDGYIMLGSGDDLIDGTGSFTGLQVSLGTGPLQPGVLDGGSGKDLITGIGNSTEFTHNANGIEISGYLTGGSDDDFIKGEARGVVSNNVSTGLSLVGATSHDEVGILDGGNGIDTITGIGINENGFGYGITTFENGAVRGGNGNDIITGDGGNGDDYFKARRINPDGTDAADQSGSIENALITGGKGNDIFDVGYGNATLDGGQGLDTLKLLGSADDYSIQSTNEDLVIVRDDYTLNALNIENLVFMSESFL
jgi:Ca2+-binding RTX toxin-like protein